MYIYIYIYDKYIRTPISMYLYTFVFMICICIHIFQQLNWSKKTYCSSQRPTLGAWVSVQAYLKLMRKWIRSQCVNMSRGWWDRLSQDAMVFHSPHTGFKLEIGHFLPWHGWFQMIPLENSILGRMIRIYIPHFWRILGLLHNSKEVSFLTW